jgi:hypothetical protein
MTDPIRFDTHFSVRLPSALAVALHHRARQRQQKPSETLRQLVLEALAAHPEPR